MSFLAGNPLPLFADFDLCSRVLEKNGRRDGTVDRVPIAKVESHLKGPLKVKQSKVAKSNHQGYLDNDNPTGETKIISIISAGANNHKA